MIAGLQDGTNNGLIFGVTIFFLSSILREQTRMIKLAERITWTWHILLQVRHFWTSMAVTLVFLCFTGLSEGLSVGLNYGLSDGWNEGLSIGLNYGWSIGLSMGLSVGLSYWLLMGFYQGIALNHLEDRDRPHFNQGIHRSLHNGVLLSLIGAAIVTGIGVLSNRLSNILSNYQVGVAQVQLGPLLISGWLVLWVAIGGLTIQRHYILRLLLARSYTFPLHSQRFLDDATARALLRRVGGGYSFVHRRLLDYFADTFLLPIDTSEAVHKTSSVPQSVSDAVDAVPGSLPSESPQN